MNNEDGYRNGDFLSYGVRPVILPPGERTPPHHLEAERGVLGGILLDEEKLLEIVDILGVDDFWRDTHQLYYRAILDLYEKGDPIDAVTVADELKAHGHWETCGGDEYLTELHMCVPHAANAVYHAHVVKKKAIARRLIESANETITEAYSHQYTAEELVGRHVERMGKIECTEISPEEDLSLHPLPEKMAPAAYRGLIGDIVGIIKPHTEACAEGILGQLLVLFAAAMGPRPHWRVGGSVHRCNLFLCLVGPTGIARKGTAFDAAYWLLTRDQRRNSLPLASGLTSGEGLIIGAKECDGSLLCVETEFGKTLANMGRENCNLSAVLRQAWDGPRLRVMTKNNPVSTDDSYIHFIGHITGSELSKKLPQNDIENGLVNRFCWLSVYRDGVLPEGGDFNSVTEALAPLLFDVTLSIEFARMNSGLDVPYMRDPDAARDVGKALCRADGPPRGSLRIGNGASGAHRDAFGGDLRRHRSRVLHNAQASRVGPGRLALLRPDSGPSFRLSPA